MFLSRNKKNNVYPCKPHFCVTCEAWQTHGDHVCVRLRPWCRRQLPRCRRHTFRFHSITLEGMYGFHSNFVELYITIKYRSSLILVIIRQILAELWSFFDLGFVEILAELWPFFNLVFVVRFHSITFEGMH